MVNHEICDLCFLYFIAVILLEDKKEKDKYTHASAALCNNAMKGSSTTNNTVQSTVKETSELTPNLPSIDTEIQPRLESYQSTEHQRTAVLHNVAKEKETKEVNQSKLVHIRMLAINVMSATVPLNLNLCHAHVH